MPGRDDAPPALHGRSFTIKSEDDELIITTDEGTLCFEARDGPREEIMRSMGGTRRIYTQPTPPKSPDENDIWIDTS